MLKPGVPEMPDQCHRKGSTPAGWRRRGMGRRGLEGRDRVLLEAGLGLPDEQVLPCLR